MSGKSILVMLIGFVALTYGVLKHGWGTEQLISIFMFMGITASSVKSTTLVVGASKDIDLLTYRKNGLI